jgi:hypothetical protein
LDETRLLTIHKRAAVPIRVTLGIYFSLAAFSDLRGSVLLLPGVAPLEFPRYVQLLTGCTVFASALLLFTQKLSKVGAGVLAAVWTLRTVWDMTGGPPISLIWTLVFGGLVIVIRSPAEDRQAPR